MARGSLIARKGFDWISFTVYISLVLIGWLMLYAVSYDPQSTQSAFTFDSSFGKQSVWLIVSLFLFGLTFTLDWKFWSTFSFLVYAFSIILLLLVLIFGSEIKGAKSWFVFGGISFQPSELAKFGTALAVSAYLSLSNVSIIKNRRNLMVVMAMFLLPSLLILLQPDAGSAAVFLGFFILLYRVGLDALYYAIAFSLIAVILLSFMYGPFVVMLLSGIIATIILSIQKQMPREWLIAALMMPVVAFIFSRLGYINYFPIVLGGFFLTLIYMNYRNRNNGVNVIAAIALTLALIFSFSSNWAFNNVLAPHQQDRINVWLRPDKCDPRGSLYNIIQSKTAIGSGGISGKGFLKGSMTQLNYIPEQQTDFIFAAIGEEQGFIGILGIVVLFTILITRLIVMAERAKNEFIRYFGYSIAGLLFMHFFINIGMTMGIMPVIGIPLPFLSKGGSALLMFSIMLGVMFKMDMDRNRTV